MDLSNFFSKMKLPRNIANHICFCCLAADSTHYVMLGARPCSIAVTMRESLTLACQHNHLSQNVDDVQETLPISSAMHCTVSSTRWHRLELHRRHFTNLTSTPGKFTTWSAKAVQTKILVDSLPQSSTSFLRITDLSEADISRYR